MAQRIGVRLNPTSGTVTLGVPLDANGYGPTLDGDTPYEYVSPDVDNAGGGTLSFFGPGGARYGLRKSVSAGSPWTIWFDPIPGEYTGFVISELDTDAVLTTVRMRVIVETDGVESEVIDVTAASTEGALSTTYAFMSGSASFTIGGTPPGYTDFWTGFVKTRENQP